MPHDLGEIVCEITCNSIILFADKLFVDIRLRIRDAGDKTISQSYEYIDLTLVDGSSVNFCSLELQRSFSRLLPPPPPYLLAR